jgi:hypothetical protein
MAPTATSACLPAGHGLRQNSLVNRNNDAVKPAASGKSRQLLRVTHIEYLPIEQSELAIRFFRIFDLLELESELLSSLAEPDQKSSIK